MLSVAVDDSAQAELRLDLFREGARRMLACALEAEVDAYIACYAELTDERRHRLVRRNGHAPARTIASGVGQVEVVRPRVDDRRVDPATGARMRFASVVLPRWCRRSPKVAAVLPLLYLHGLSSSDFVPALAELLGSAAGLSASVITRLTQQWQAEREAFAQRDLGEVDYVYCWADGIHFNVRLGEQGRLCCLVIVGVRADGRKELVAVADGTRESAEDWAELLRDLRRRGMRAPVVMVGDGALGLWRALSEVFPETREQRCWVHKVRNVLGALPKSVHAGARRALNEIILAEDRGHAERAIDALVTDYGAKWPKAVAKVTGDAEALLGFFDYPAEHWLHLRTTNPRARSRRSGLAPGSPRGRAAKTRGWRWCSSCLRRPRAAGGRSTGRTWSPWSGPGRGSSAAGWSSDPRRRLSSRSTRSPRDHAGTGDRRVEPGRGAAVAGGPFPRPAPPNPACQSSRHRALPEPPPACATGAVGRWIRSTRGPRRPGIHQEPPALPATPGRLAASLRPAPGSPGLRLLRRLRHARTPPADGAPAHHPAGDVGRFPRSPLADRRGRCPAESRQHRHRYAAGLPDGLLLGPVLRGRSRPPARPRRACAATRPASARFGAGRQRTGRQHWFLAYTFSSCLPDPGRLAVPTRPVVVGAAPTLPGTSQARLPPASPACCDRPAVESFHLHSVKRSLVAHHRI